MRFNVKLAMQAVADVFFPRHCPVCDRLLGADEHYVCCECLMKLPVTHYENTHFNVMEQLFAGKVPIERAAAYFFYERNDPYAAFLHDIKYHNMPILAHFMARQAVAHMQDSHLWQGIDYLLPVPLHVTKLAQRGYNQSDFIAQGLSESTGIAIYDGLEAVKAHDTQTRKGLHDRYVNAKGLYAIVPEALQELQGKHVMIVDDVVTTGATLLACAESVAHISNIKISLFTLTATRQHI